MYKILMIYDERDILEMLALQFQSEGYLVYLANDANEALKQLSVLPDLMLGGDDYITKPFSMDELFARVQAHLRREKRSSHKSRGHFTRELIIDYSQRTVIIKNKKIDFSNKEFEIIKLLSMNAGQIFDREKIYEVVWGFEANGDSAVIKEHIRKIRMKLSRYRNSVGRRVSMEKIKQQFYNMSLKKSLLLILSVALFLIIILSSTTVLLTSSLRQMILDNRTIHIAVDTAIISENITGTYEISPSNDEYQYSELANQDKFIYLSATVAMIALPTLYLVLGTIFIVKIYYRLKLALPIEQLNIGIANLTNNNLDFQITYNSNDELGRLCSTLEVMRNELIENNQKVWELLDQRKALTASVSHDLRTPITVLKGYLDYLLKNLPEKRVSDDVLLTTLKSMAHSSARLERYVECIQDIQKIEDIEISKTMVVGKDFLEEINNDFMIIAKNNHKDLVLEAKIVSKQLYLDKQIIFKILENLLNNAFRFANNGVKLTIMETVGYLEFVIQDDGPGFSKKDLENATTLFYSSQTNKGSFGIGLSISHILCEKHGGILKLLNNENGACAIVQIKK